MSDYFLGEIRIFSFGYAPSPDWAKCNGAVLTINQNQALYTLLGTQFGGDGKVNFQLPDLRGRTPVSLGTLNGTSYLQGKTGGTENVTLTAPQLAPHSHGFAVYSNTATTSAQDNSIYAAVGSAMAQYSPQNMYAAPGGLVTLVGATVGNAGAGLPHSNLQPYIVINFSISISGIYPSRP